jgi:hypothetical protein
MHLFGSKLIKKHFPDFRNPNDIDWITNDKSKLKPSTKEEEFYYIPNSPNREMTPNEIYTLKVSHAIYDIHWKKTMSDIRFLQIKGCKLIPNMLSELREYWIEIHGEQHRTDFEVKPGDFFEDRVKRKIDHDELHKMINPTPTYQKMIKNDVNPDSELFFKLTKDEQKEVLYEEAFVISIERFSNYPDSFAYNKAQQNLVTRLHPIWIADYIIENWNKWYWVPRNSKFYKNYVTIKNKL